MGRKPTGDKPKDVIIAIRADRGLKRRFKVFVAEQGFDSASNALEYLLDAVEEKQKENRRLADRRFG